MRTLIILKLTLILFTLNSAAQTKPKNQWFWQADLGYSFTGASGIKNISDMTITNDSIRSFSTSWRLKENGSRGPTFNAEALYRKKSGWTYVLGIQSFFGPETEIFMIAESVARQAIERDGGYPTFFLKPLKNKEGYLVAKCGIGYETKNLRSARLLVYSSFLLGGGWRTSLKGDGFEYYDYEYFHWNYFDTFLKTYGINLSVQSALYVSKPPLARICNPCQRIFTKTMRKKYKLHVPLS